MTVDAVILTLNAGSSSLKFSVYAPPEGAGGEPQEMARGQVESLGPAATLTIASAAEKRGPTSIGAADHAVALQAILVAAREIAPDAEIAAVGHRIVHGGVDYAEPILLDDAALLKLRALSPLAPLHQPHNLSAVGAAREAFPRAPQIGCFDTAFHRGHPFVNDVFGLPRRYYEKGVRRYGFHGLSYQYITTALAELAPQLHAGRVVVAHLGNGASMCAIKGGASVGSTMGFSALDGLPMGTRSGQLDPGVLLYLMEEEGLGPGEIASLLYKESGLKGLSGVSHDMRTLLASDDPQAREAIDYFVFRIRRELGAMAAVLGGVDGLVFTGGIGEHAAEIRARVCEGMGWLGLGVDAAANTGSAPAAGFLEIGEGPARVLALRTDEERVIARAAARVLESGAA